MSVAECVKPGSTPKLQRVTKAWQNSCCCCEHTHACCRIHQFGFPPKRQWLQWFSRPAAAASRYTCVLQKKFQGWSGRPRPTVSENTHVYCRMSQLEVAPKDQELPRFGRPSAAVLQKNHFRVGLADHVLLWEHTCVLQNKSFEGCTQGSTCYKGLADQAGLLRAYT